MPVPELWASTWAEEPCCLARGLVQPCIRDLLATLARSSECAKCTAAVSVCKVHCSCQCVSMRCDRVFPMGWSLPAVLTLWVAQASPLMIPAKNGTTCPGTSSYDEVGYYKERL